jgi:transglutaminase-like putative cysteine protease
MQRSVMARLECDVITPVDAAIAIAVARGPSLIEESFEMSVNGAPLQYAEIADDHGTRLHVTEQIPRGQLTIRYAATVGDLAPIADVQPIDLIRYLRPSRYCESDQLSPVARAEFSGLFGADLLAAVSSWVGTRLGYVQGSSRPTDGAVATMLARRGVCRDFAHLAIAFLRACEVPARLASVYAPGLSPMDFHAVAEAHVDGAWQVVDATCLAPRATMVRIATGRDAADTAFLNTAKGVVTLTGIEVIAYTDETLPRDDMNGLVQLR